MTDNSLELLNKSHNFRSKVYKCDLMAVFLVGKSLRKWCLEENSNQYFGRKNCIGHFADQSTLCMVTCILHTDHHCYRKFQLGISQYS